MMRMMDFSSWQGVMTTLGGSFSGNLSVDPTHLRDLLSQRAAAEVVEGSLPASDDDIAGPGERARRTRDAVEAALSDVILLGNDEHVRLAANAATDLAAGRPVHTDELVVSLRDFVRVVLDLEPVPSSLAIPKQGPTRPASGGGSDGGRGRGGGGEGRGGGGGGGGGDAGGGGGMGLGMGLGLGRGLDETSA